VQDFPLPPAPAGLALGDSHTTELAYVFGHDGRGNRLPTRADRRLSAEVIDYWTNLASSGDPNHEVNRHRRVAPKDGDDATVEQRPSWPSFTVLSGIVQVLAKPVGQEADFATAHQCALWASLGYPEHLLSALPPSP
jgi:carboxylesterase type B